MKKIKTQVEESKNRLAKEIVQFEVTLTNHFKPCTMVKVSSLVPLFEDLLTQALQERDRIAEERGIAKERERIIALAGGEPYLYVPNII